MCDDVREGKRLTTYQQSAGAGWKVDGDVLQAGGAVWEGEGEVVHSDCW